MSDKSKICAIGEKKLIGGKWYEKAPAGTGCRGCVWRREGYASTACSYPEVGGTDCHNSIWIACDQPQPETPAVEECAGCRYWKDCGDIGDCHRSGPVYIEGVTFGQWPTTKRGDWCGEWKA